MGYYVKLMYTDAFLPSENKDAALNALIELNSHDEYKYKYASNSSISRHFSWMPDDYTHYESVEEVLTDLGFEFESRADGIVFLGYDDKIGAEDLHINAIAHLLKEGSSFKWTGEDGAAWQWKIEDGKMLTAYVNNVFQPWPSFTQFQPRIYT